jgi:hypothetical protein
VRALALGRSFVGLDALAPADGFSFTTGGGPEPPRIPWSMGDVVPPEPGLRLRAGGRLPERARLTVLRDGVPLAQADRAIDVAAPGPGVYRVEAADCRGWDVAVGHSNPISVFPAETAKARRRPPSWPAAPLAPPARTRVLDSFDGPTTFNPEFDASSSMAADVSRCPRSGGRTDQGRPGSSSDSASPPWAVPMSGARW